MPHIDIMNKEFQELKRQWGVNSAERKDIIQKMRDNLIQRNKYESLYVFEYTSKGTTINLSDCDIEDLFSADGDMNPRGM